MTAKKNNHGGELKSPKDYFMSGGGRPERGRLFVAMPFRAPHSEVLWRVISGICEIHDWHPARADEHRAARPIVTDILEEIDRAEIVIADLTDHNANVLYELGIAHVLCDTVILVGRKGMEVPFDLSHIRIIYFDFDEPEGRSKFSRDLESAIENSRKRVSPVFIDSAQERTQKIVADLKKLLLLPRAELKKEEVWISGAMTALAIVPDEFNMDIEHRVLDASITDPVEYQNALMQEKETLLELARNSCPIKCIISPPAKDLFNTVENRRKFSYLINRMKHLVGFLENGGPEYDSIEWAVSSFRQKSLMIIGGIACFEGYKDQMKRGYGITIRQTGKDAIATHVTVYKALFERCKAFTLTTYPPGPASSPMQALRKSTAKCLREILDSIPFED